MQLYEAAFVDKMQKQNEGKKNVHESVTVSKTSNWLLFYDYKCV